MNKSKNSDLNANFGVSQIQDVLKVCSMDGLWPITFDNIQVANTISIFARQKFFNINGKGGIPLGFDPDCAKKGCSGTFYSFDGNNELGGLVKNFN